MDSKQLGNFLASITQTSLNTFTLTLTLSPHSYIINTQPNAVPLGQPSLTWAIPCAQTKRMQMNKPCTSLFHTQPNAAPPGQLSLTWASQCALLMSTTLLMSGWRAIWNGPCTNERKSWRLGSTRLRICSTCTRASSCECVLGFVCLYLCVMCGRACAYVCV